MGFVYSQIKHPHFLSPNRLEKRGREDIQAQTDLFSRKRKRRDKRRFAFVLDEKHVFWQEVGLGSVCTYGGVCADNETVKNALIEEAKRIWKDYNEEDNNLYLKKVDNILI